MAKRYSEELAEWVRQRALVTLRDRNVVAFLALKGDVRDALHNGFAVKTIWAHLHEEKRVAFGYDTFLNYVNKYVRGAGGQVDRSPVGRAGSCDRRGAAEGTKKGGALPLRTPPQHDAHKPAAALGGFRFNAAPNVEELI